MIVDPLTSHRNAAQRRPLLEHRRHVGTLLLAVSLFLVMPGPVRAQSGSALGAQDVNASSGDRHALIIGGLGGGKDQTARFEQYLLQTRRALVENFGFSPGNVTVLAEQALADQPFVDDVSLSDNVEAAFAALARRVGSNDQVYVILFGHGSVTGDRAYLNIPRRDLSDLDYAALVDTLPTRRVVFVNTASASSPFVEALSGEGRVIITATRAPSQRNETAFPEFFVQALSSPSADRDRNGNLSVFEVFTFAAEATDRSFADAGHIPTENALLDDTGDGEGRRLSELEGSGEGSLAAVTFLRSRSQELAALAGALPDSVRSGVETYLIRREALNEEVAGVKARKGEMTEDAYYDRLEVIFVELARIEAAIESARSGS